MTPVSGAASLRREAITTGCSSWRRSKRPFGSASLFQNDLALMFEPHDFVGRQRVGQTKSDEISRAFALEMRQTHPEMETGNKVTWVIWRRIFVCRTAHSTGTMLDSTQAGKRGFTVAAGILPAVEPGFQPGGTRVRMNQAPSNAPALRYPQCCFRAAGCRPLRQPGW